MSLGIIKLIMNSPRGGTQAMASDTGGINKE